MNFNKIDIENWNRQKTYHHYISEVPCTYSMCVNIDVTNLMHQTKEKGIKFFPALLYGLTYIVNKHKEFRMAINEQGDVGYYDTSNPCFTVFHEAVEAFTEVWTEYSEDFFVFYDNYIGDMNEYQHNPNESKPITSNNLFNVSCIPWASFTGFNLNLQMGYDYLPPIFTIGKYFNNDNKLLIPLAIQVHHAVCDGFHTARFVNELQEWANSFAL